MRAVVLMLVACSLAGCAGDAREPVAEGMPIGTLHGVVVDPALIPLVGATVRVDGTALETTTDGNGSFSFPDLEPGTYAVSASKAGYFEAGAVGAVLADARSPVVKIVLHQDLDQVPYSVPYYFQGYFECGGGVDDITCSNVNIITWVILGIGNVTTDRSLFLQWIDGPPTALQTELVWSSTQRLGDRLGFAVGGATEEQLSTGQATTHNYTFGQSPLVLTIPQPELGESGIGVDRALLTQVIPAPYQEVPGGCLVYNPCGPGLQLMQPFETFTHAFYGFEPQPGWQFSIDGPPQPA